jgi:hypothetical protein
MFNQLELGLKPEVRVEIVTREGVEEILSIAEPLLVPRNFRVTGDTGAIARQELLGGELRSGDKR